MTSARADIGLALCVIAGASVYLWTDGRLPAVRLGDPLGPKAFPALVGIGLIVSALLLLFERRRGAAPAAPAEPVDAVPGARFHPLILVAMAAWTALYYAVFEHAGYLVATAVFLFGLLCGFNRGRHKTNVAVAVGFTLVFDLLFAHVLGVPMPAGWLAL